MYSINDRKLSHRLPIQDELHFDANTNYSFDLSYLSSLDVLGEKAYEFLQGQLSCDVREVNQHHMRPGALCNLQGRILALLDVVNWDGCHLILPNDLLDATQTSLTKAAFFSRVELKPNPSLRVFGFYLQNPQDCIPFNATLPSKTHDMTATDFYCCYQLTDNLYVFLVNSNHTNAFQESMNEQHRGSLAWHALTLQAGLIEIYPNSRGLFLPHRLGLQNTDYLSFNKGCYKGQEIIARTHYRAKLKHDMKLFTVEMDSVPHSGQTLLDPETHAELGELIDYAPIADNTYLLAISSLFEHSSTVLFGEFLRTLL
ncbi:MAG: folate-binding protein YgfZ [Legionellaceae bacterium]|nr:folate-binding protein YgfZ [Legionellaceae bacterium]